MLDQSFHLLIRTPQGNISHCMRHLLSQYTRYYNQLKKRHGALFSGRYKSVLVEGDEHILQVSRFIHRLPREKKITRHIATCSWSSYPSYAGLHKAEPWLKRDELLQFMAKRNGQALYRIYVETGEDKETDNFYRKRKLSAVLGSTEFKKQVLDTSKIDLDEVPQAKEFIEKPSIANIIKAVAEEFSVSMESIRLSKKGRGNSNMPRSVALCLCRKLGGHSLKTIAKEFKINHYSAVSVAIKRLNQCLEQDADTSDSLQRVRDKLAA